MFKDGGTPLKEEVQKKNQAGHSKAEFFKHSGTWAPLGEHVSTSAVKDGHQKADERGRGMGKALRAHAWRKRDCGKDGAGLGELWGPFCTCSSRPLATCSSHCLQSSFCTSTWNLRSNCGIYLSSLSSFHHPHVYILAPRQPWVACEQELCGWVSQNGAHYLLIWFKNDWSVNTHCKGVVSNENVKFLLTRDDRTNNTACPLWRCLGNIRVCGTWLDRQRDTELNS